jgi:hypothetical protein
MNPISEHRVDADKLNPLGRIIRRYFSLHAKSCGCSFRVIKFDLRQNSFGETHSFSQRGEMLGLTAINMLDPTLAQLAGRMAVKLNYKGTSHGLNVADFCWRRVKAR